MKTMTIRNIPDEVAAYIYGKATEEGRSINTLTVGILCRAAGFVAPQKKRRDLSWIAGSWSSAETHRFNAAVGECRQVDLESWR